MHHKLLTGLLFFFIPFTLSAQRTISGHVTDASGAPIRDAHVFIANTTVGMITNAAGYYRLQIPGEGSYRLTASHVAYEPVFVDMKPGKNSLRLDLKMQANVLDAVEISAKVNFRKRDIDLFWNTLLGKKPSKNTIYAVNPEAVFFKYDVKTSVLRVTSRVPLEIINKETGYLIQFVLDEFTHDYRSRLSSWTGECKFIELEPENDLQRELWEKNREKTYKVSMNYFIKSLYNNSLPENGFLLVHEGQGQLPNRPATIIDGSLMFRESPYNIDTNRKLYLATTENYVMYDLTDNNKTLYIEPYSDPLILVCFGKPVTERDMVNVMSAQNRHKRWEIIGEFRNKLDTPEEPVHIFSDGTYMNEIQFSPFFSPQSITGLNMSLPIEYEPRTVYDTSSPIFAGTLAESINNVASRFSKQLIAFPQEKIHLQTDKPYYISGERIWFRAHVVNAAVHIPVLYSNCVYVELYDAKDWAVSRVKITPENGTFSGYLPIPKDIQEGNYTIRAYTNRMEHLDEDYFFMKTVCIGNPMTHTMQGEHAGSVPATKSDKRISTQPVVFLPEDDFDVSFYPEGGYALCGSTGRIAFKALQQNGSEIDVNGIVYDSRKNEMTRFKTDVRGMGQLLLTPERGETYYAVCSNGKGQEKRFALPVAREDGYALSATWHEDSLMVKVRQAEPANKSDVMFLIVHTRGIIEDVSILDNLNEKIAFHKDNLLSGVTNLLLLNRDMIPVSERLVFVHNDDQANVVCKTDTDIYSARSAVAYSVNISDESGEPLQGNVSVSVTDDHEVAVDTSCNILTSLLLTSDLRGNIPEPAFFFHNKHALDLLMLTQGWRRYDTEKIIRGDLVYPDTLFNSRHSISGTVKRQQKLKSKPEENANVSILSLDGNFFDVAVTDRNGRFYFNVGDAPDSTWFIAQTAPLGSNKRVLTLDDESYPARMLPSVDFKTHEQYLSKYVTKAQQQYIEENGDENKVEQLSEVVITGQKPIRKSSYYSMPDRTISVGQLVIPPSSMKQLLTQFPGLTLTDSAAYLLRFQNSSKPIPVLWLVDDMPAGYEPPDYLRIDDIEQIDLLTSPNNLLMFGLNGAGGVIAIHTQIRQKVDMINTSYNRIRQRSRVQMFDTHVKRIMPLGFQKPAGFYAPKYDTPAQNTKPDFRTTIHWQPNLATDENGTASFSFYTADTPSTYTVVIEGVTDDGKIVYKRDKVVVDP